MNLLFWIRCKPEAAEAGKVGNSHEATVIRSSVTQLRLKCPREVLHTLKPSGAVLNQGYSPGFISSKELGEWSLAFPRWQFGKLFINSS